jgi:hypothetical protein
MVSRCKIGEGQLSAEAISPHYSFMDVGKSTLETLSISFYRQQQLLLKFVVIKIQA